MGKGELIVTGRDEDEDDKERRAGNSLSREEE